MIRDTSFSLPRFADVCRKEMVESWKTNVLRIVMMYGALAIVFIWNGYFQYESMRRGSTVATQNDPIWSFELNLFIVTGKHLQNGAD